MECRESLGRRVRVGAAIQQPGGELVVRIRGREQERVRSLGPVEVAARSVARRFRIGSESFMSAPALISASTAAIRPSRAANRIAVNPPFERALTSAPRATSVSMTGAYPSAAAHISAV